MEGFFYHWSNEVVDGLMDIGQFFGDWHMNEYTDFAELVHFYSYKAL